MRIDVPKEVATCVRRLNGRVLDEVLRDPTFSNADYWFPDERVVAELKCLTEDLSSNAAFNNRVAELHASWVKRRLVPRPTSTRSRINLQDLPLECAHEFIDPIKRKLESSALKKANLQIRETKKYLSAPDAKGLLLLVNDGNYVLPPSMMVYLLARSLKGQYTSISSVIYFSVNDPVSAPSLGAPSLFWIDGLIPGREPVSSEFRQLFLSAWIAHYSLLVPETVFEFEGSKSRSFIDSLQFPKNHAA